MDALITALRELVLSNPCADLPSNEQERKVCADPSKEMFLMPNPHHSGTTINPLSSHTTGLLFLFIRPEKNGTLWSAVTFESTPLTLKVSRSRIKDGSILLWLIVCSVIFLASRYMTRIRPSYRTRKGGCVVLWYHSLRLYRVFRMDFQDARPGMTGN